jgi:uncharacterized protein (TIGR00375 family)
MEFVTDLHLHSKYSRAVSKDMTLQNMSMWASKKGLDILSTSDWTHPLWFREITKELVEEEEGLFKAKGVKNSKTRFLLSVEVSSIYTQNGKVHRIHNLIFSPSIKTSELISKELVKRGCNLSSDGRPIIGLSSISLAELVFSIDEKAMIIPCHIWTPWFSLYGANSGFDTIEECFGEYSKYIYGVETGLSSDPYMNWQIKDLDNKSILSFSDAHSLPKMGREATVFKSINGKISYKEITDAIKQKSKNTEIFYTIEFYPEEGKYHYTGHRNCNFVQDTVQSKANGNICPVCKRPLTIGVMHRVEELAKTNKFSNEASKLNPNGVKWILNPKTKHPPFVKLVPLNEIIAESLNSTVASNKVKEMFDNVCNEFGNEINVLLRTPIEDIRNKAGDRIAEGVEKVRSGNIVILPGFDGQYGIVKIWNDKKINDKAKESVSQLGIDF